VSIIRVVQCWDDGVEDDIRLCGLLREFGAKASFNLNPGLHGATRGEPWFYKDVKPVRRLARGELAEIYQGFTIANHTVSHPWALKISLEDWRREVVDGRAMLQDWFGQPVFGFAYPFGQRSDATDHVVCEAGHLYARGTARIRIEEPPGFPPVDPFRFVPDCHFRDPGLLQKFAAAKENKAPVFYFWGHSYEMIREKDWEQTTNILQAIASDPDAIWENLPNLFR